MAFVEATFVSQHGTAPASLLASVHPGMAVLRRAIRANAVTFPSHVPILLKQPPAEMQWRSVLLYFVCGWTSTAIAARFNVPVHRIWHLLNQWAVRAAALGYIQVIDAEAFASCCHVRMDHASSMSGLAVRPAAAEPAGRPNGDLNSSFRANWAKGPLSTEALPDRIPSIVAAKRLPGIDTETRISNNRAET